MTRGLHTDDATLLALLAGELTGDEADLVAAHLAGCPSCARARDALAEVRASVVSLHAVPQDLARRRARLQLEASLRQEALRSRSTLRGGRLALVVAVAAASGAALAMSATGALGTSPFASGRSDASAEPRSAEPRSAEPRSVEPRSVEPRSAEPRSAEPLPGEPLPGEPLPSERPPAVTPPAAPPVDAEPGSAGPASSNEMARSPADRHEAGRPLASRPSRPLAGPDAMPPTVVDSPPFSRASLSRDGSVDVLAGTPLAAAPADAPRVARAQGTPSTEEALSRALHDLSGAVPGAPGWADVGDLAALAGKPAVAADAWTKALAGQEAARAAERLDRLVQSGALSPAEAERSIRAVPGATGRAEALRLLCAWGLMYRGDRAAVQACQSFGRQFPDHPEVRTLALSAGRTAEVKLDDLRLAEEEYSRALLVSQYAGLPGTSALFARARVRWLLGDLEEARADLRLFLHVQPEARWREDVAALAAELRVALPAP